MRTAGGRRTAAAHSCAFPHRRCWSHSLPPTLLSIRAQIRCSLSLPRCIHSDHLQVILVDRAAAQLDKALAGMQASLGKLARKGALADDPAEVLARLQTATELEVGGAVQQRSRAWQPAIHRLGGGDGTLPP